MNLCMCVYVLYEHTQTHTHTYARTHTHTQTNTHTVHGYRHVFPHTDSHQKQTTVTKKLSLGIQACLRNIWSPGEFSVSAGGDLVISGLFYMQFGITCYTQHAVYSPIVRKHTDDPGRSCFWPGRREMKTSLQLRRVTTEYLHYLYYLTLFISYYLSNISATKCFDKVLTQLQCRVTMAFPGSFVLMLDQQFCDLTVL